MCNKEGLHIDKCRSKYKALKVFKSIYKEETQVRANQKPFLGYTPNEIVFETHNRTKGPPRAELRAIAQDAVHSFQKCEEVHALARRAMIHVQD